MVNFKNSNDREFLTKLNAEWAEVENFKLEPNLQDSKLTGKQWESFSKKVNNLIETLDTDTAKAAENVATEYAQTITQTADTVAKLIQAIGQNNYTISDAGSIIVNVTLDANSEGELKLYSNTQLVSLLSNLPHKFTIQVLDKESSTPKFTVKAEDATDVIKELFYLKVLEFIEITNNLLPHNEKLSAPELAWAITDYYFYNLDFIKKLKPYTLEVTEQVTNSAAKPQGYMQEVRKMNPDKQVEITAITQVEISAEEKRIVAAIDAFNENKIAKAMIINVQGALYPAPGMLQKGQGILPLFHKRLQEIRTSNDAAYQFTTKEKPVEDLRQEQKTRFEKLSSIVSQALTSYLGLENNNEKEFAKEQQSALGQADSADAVKAIIKTIMKNPHSDKYTVNSLVFLIIKELLVCDYKDEFFTNTADLQMPEPFSSRKFNEALKNLKEDYRPNHAFRDRASKLINNTMNSLRRFNFYTSNSFEEGNNNDTENDSIKIASKKTHTRSPLPFADSNLAIAPQKEETQKWIDLFTEVKALASAFSGTALSAGESFIGKMNTLEIQQKSSQSVDIKTSMIIELKDLFKSPVADCSIPLKHTLVNYLFNNSSMRADFFEPTATDASVADYNDTAARGSALLLLLKPTFRPIQPTPANQQQQPNPTPENM